jgi:hypothetical protein
MLKTRYVQNKPLRIGSFYPLKINVASTSQLNGNCVFQRQKRPMIVRRSIFGEENVLTILCFDPFNILD